MLKKLIVVLLCCAPLPLCAEVRSFDAIFPLLPATARQAVFSDAGYFGASSGAAGLVLAGAGLDPRIGGAVLDKKPLFLVESLLVIPKAPNTVTLLDVYNALGNIRLLKGRPYFSETRGKQVPLFEDATRLESAKKNTPVPDPRPASAVPRAETVFIRLKDANFGNTYYRGEMAADNYGIRYCLSNYKNVTYLFVPVIKEEQFTVQLYFEPVAEGVLIYGLAGVDVSDFAAARIDIPSAIRKRLAVIIAWVAEGIGKAK